MWSSSAFDSPSDRTSPIVTIGEQKPPNASWGIMSDDSRVTADANRQKIIRVGTFIQSIAGQSFTYVIRGFNRLPVMVRQIAVAINAES